MGVAGIGFLVQVAKTSLLKILKFELNCLPSSLDNRHRFWVSHWIWEPENQRLPRGSSTGSTGPHYLRNLYMPMAMSLMSYVQTRMRLFSAGESVVFLALIPYSPQEHGVPRCKPQTLASKSLDFSSSAKGPIWIGFPQPLQRLRSTQVIPLEGGQELGAPRVLGLLVQDIWAAAEMSPRKKGDFVHGERAKFFWPFRGFQNCLQNRTCASPETDNLDFSKNSEDTTHCPQRSQCSHDPLRAN